MKVAVREWTHWAAGYGLPRASLKLLARRGDPLARLLTIDTNPVDDIYPLIEQVRAARPDRRVRSDAATTRDGHAASKSMTPRTISPLSRSV